MALPPVRVEIAFASAPDDPNPVWVDVTDWVRLDRGLSWNRGRADEFANVEPGRLSLVLDNTDGRFTFADASSPYYPNVVPLRRVRVLVDVDSLVAASTPPPEIYPGDGLFPDTTLFPSSELYPEDVTP